ncbi:OprD family porin [Pseudomonas mosselii]|uniref:OprD family porin n=1 Tax=Pseudomonas mosselii TaxID=78327 RepID=UPI000A264094|nr:OprD family porin [Pseudomonas mosselii]MBC3449981.1 OprD family porin [Pseudomonas mosselii]MEA3236817.1 OprD family porin [Pseudomonas mosselii]ORT72218.1 porin [Pseudomonas mosselii]UWS68106.1 OprD family porin [Pseudomonas mosselii]
MSFAFRFTPLFVALAATMPMAAQADEAKADGFIEGSTLNLHFRNAYFNRNEKNASIKDKREWGQGAVARFESGYTPGVIGFGLDAHAMVGLKLDGGGGRAGTSILPSAPEDKARHAFSTAGGAIKLKGFDTEFKAGDLFLTNPVIAGGESRMLPQTFRGVAVTNRSIDGLMLEGGKVSFTKPYNQSGHRRINTYYSNQTPEQDSQNLSWAGASWSGTEGVTANIYAAELKDIWNQYYADFDYTYQVNDLVSLNPGVHFYHTQDTGQSKLGDIDNNTWSVHFTVAAGYHSVTAAYQRVNGDTPFDYINLGDSIFLDNSRMYSDFNAPNERSWKLQYDYDFAGLGMPGLSTSLSYSRGKADLTKASQDTQYYAFYNADGENARHWERDFDVKYVFQQGQLKDLSVLLRYATHRANAAYSDIQDNDEFRVIVDYPLNVF